MNQGNGWRRLGNVFHLGVKELRSLLADKVLLLLIVWAFTGAIFEAATGQSQELHHVPVAVADADRSPLSARIAATLHPPYFRVPEAIAAADIDAALDAGRYSFILVFPPNFERDLAAGRRPELQLHIDATLVSQAFIGAGYIRNYAQAEVDEFLAGRPKDEEARVRLVTRARFNPNLTGLWFGGVMEAVNNVTMLAIILVGAAYIREREHGTLEHLLAMPLKPIEVMLAKIWANGFAVFLGVGFAVIVMVRELLRVPIAGSIPLFLCGTAFYLYSAASMGIFLGTLARSMPQFGLLTILTIIPLQLLSGGITPRESMPELVQNLMLATPTTYYVRLSQGILYRGAGLDVVWPDFLAMVGLGALFFVLALLRFRRSITLTQV